MFSTLDDKMQHEIFKGIRDVGLFQMRQRGSKLFTKNKVDHSPVTVVDLESHQKICSMLMRIDPQTPILSEETDNSINFLIRDAPRFWCVDPLDGTRDYIEGSKHFAINLALYCKGEVVWSLIYHPPSDEFLVADRSQSRVYFIDPLDVLNEVKIPHEHGPINSVLTSARVSMNSNRKHQFLSFAPHLSEDAHILAVSSSFKFFLLFKNHAQAYIRKAPCMIWDVAPGFLAAELVGMSIINIDTHKPFEWPQNALDRISSFAILRKPI